MIDIKNVTKSTSKIVRVVGKGKKPVYDITVRDTHRINANGFYTSNCNHPEIETFINIKRDLKKVTGANISVKVSDAFMKAVESDSEFTLYWPTDVTIEDAKVTKIVRAKDIWEQMMQAAWESAEPGVLFWDAVKRETPADMYEEFESISTNPCGEIALSSCDACRLLLINLTGYVVNPFTPSAKFDYDKFSLHVKYAQRLMDDLVDLELEAVDKIIAKIKSDPEPEFIKQTELELWKKIRQAGERGRRTGLGITGLGDALAMLNVKYGCSSSITVTTDIYRCLAVNAHKSSVEMAEERGAFPACFPGKGFDDHPFMKRLAAYSDAETNDAYQKHGRRNICLTTTAPAGSVSIMTQTTSGIEPAYLLEYKRRKKINPNDTMSRVDHVDSLGDKWQEYVVRHRGLQKWMEITGETDIAKSPYYGATSNDVNWVASVDLQAAAQRFIEHCLSKTCNVPNNATKELISEIYMRAWSSGCKGFTVYRDGCRSGVLVKNDSEEEKNEAAKTQPSKIVENHAPKRPKELNCDIHQVTVKGEKWTILVGLMGDKAYEVFGGLSKYVEVPKRCKKGTLVKNGKRDSVSTYNLVWGEGDDQTVIKDVVSVFENATMGAFTRTLSLALRHGIPVNYVCEQLQKDSTSDIQSFSRVIARVLKNYIVDGTKSTEKQCPECKTDDSLVFQEGCVKCVSCGYSRCG